jgi:hypothetical protein
LTQEHVTRISVYEKTLIFDPALSQAQQTAIVYWDAYDKQYLTPSETELDVLHTSAFYCGREGRKVVAERVAAALHTSGFPAEIIRPEEQAAA